MAKENIKIGLNKAGERQGKVNQPTGYVQKFQEKKTWKKSGKKYKRVNMELDVDVFMELKNDVMRSKTIKCESQLINAIFEHYLKNGLKRVIENDLD